MNAIDTDTLRAAAEAQLAARSNAAARATGWFAATWNNQGVFKGHEKAALKREATLTDTAQYRIIALVGDDWTPVADIIARHQRECPDRSAAAIKKHCVVAQKAGLIEGRIERNGNNQLAKQYRRSP